MGDSQKKDALEEILRAWAADRENASRLAISHVTHESYPPESFGSDVTPDEPWGLIVRYTVTKDVVFRVNADEMGDFLVALSKVAGRGPL